MVSGCALHAGQVGRQQIATAWEHKSYLIYTGKPPPRVKHIKFDYGVHNYSRDAGLDAHKHTHRQMSRPSQYVALAPCTPAFVSTAAGPPAATVAACRQHYDYLGKQSCMTKVEHDKSASPIRGSWQVGSAAWASRRPSPEMNCMDHSKLRSTINSGTWQGSAALWHMPSTVSRQHKREA